MFVVCQLAAGIGPSYPSARLAPEGIYKGSQSVLGIPFKFVAIRTEARAPNLGRGGERIAGIRFSIIALALDIVAAWCAGVVLLFALRIRSVGLVNGKRRMLLLIAAGTLTLLVAYRDTTFVEAIGPYEEDRDEAGAAAGPLPQPGRRFVRLPHARQIAAT